MKTLRTTKLFYGKWYYKVTLWFKGCEVFAYHSPAEVVAGLLATSPLDQSCYILDVICNRQESYILEMARLLSKFPMGTWADRIERCYFSIYTNDNELYNAVITDFYDDVCECYAPNLDDMELLLDPKVIVCNKLPHNKYEYKVFVCPSRISGSIAVEERHKLLNWMESQFPKMTCTLSFKKWFIGTWWGSERRYFLVDNENTLLLLRMFHPEIIVSVHKYVVSTAIL